MRVEQLEHLLHSEGHVVLTKKCHDVTMSNVREFRFKTIIAL